MTSTPSTTLQPMSKAYDPAATEPLMWTKWMDSNAFHADPDRAIKNNNAYTILIPPPNVTAALHLGHALNNSIQDILIRAHRMKGFETLWMPGTDHAGIATQTMVDKKLKEAGKPGIADYKKKELAGENGREDFLKLVYDFKDQYEARITEQLMAMGCSCDWQRQRFTMDDICARAVREAFFQLFKDGLIYRGKRLVNWDPITQTALADDEVEMEDVKGHFWYMKYPVVDDAGNETGEFVTVATTRPETYLGDTGVAVNPKDPKHAKFIGMKVKLPFVGRIIPIIGDDYVVMADPESSDAKAQYASGFLKVTPAHDQNDWAIGLRHDLKVINIMAPDASISDQHGWEDIGDASQFVGLSREDARIAIEKAFDKAGLLAEKKPYTHAVGHSYRSHAAIEPYLSDQWYCKVTDDKLRGNAQRALKPEQRTEASLQAWPESAPGGPARRAGSSRNQLNTLQNIPEFTLSGPLSSGLLHQGTPTAFTPSDPLPKGSKAPSQLEHTKRNLPHLQLPNATYFVTWRTTNNRTLSDIDSACIIESLDHRHGDSAEIDAVVIMPDHVHLLVRMKTQTDLSKWISDLKRFTARTINNQSNTAGSLWQDEHFDRIVRDENEYVDHLTYIIDNPIKAKLTQHRHEWKHCLLSESVVSALTGVLEEPGSASRATEESTDGTMSFFPARYAKTYETWHDNLRDWCISRQLWWGHRIPIWRWFPHDSKGGQEIDTNGNVPSAALQSTIELFQRLATACGLANDFVIKPEGDDIQSWILICCRNTRAERLLDAVNLCEYGFRDAASIRLDYEDVLISDECCVLLDAFVDTNDGSPVKQDPDVLDTWFSSALWPLSTMGWPDATAAKKATGIEDFESMLEAFNPSSVLTTAREIITLWVSRMTMFNRYFLPGGPARRAGSSEPSVDQKTIEQQEPGSANRATESQPGPAPFKNVFIHAMIQDGQGRKMSKSLGNGVDPLDIIHSHGADAMRFTLCQMTTQTQDVRMPVEMDETTGKNTSPKFDIGRNLCNKLWNASKFAMMMLEKNPIQQGLPIDPQELSLVDRWMLSRVVHATGAINAALRNYMFKDYADAIYDLLWRDFCDWYLESIKPTVADDANQAAVLRLVLDSILRLMHPVTPFITESIHERLSTIPMREITGFSFDQTRTTETLCQSGWPSPDQALRDEVAEQAYDRIQTLITLIREIRASNKVHAKRSIVLHVSGSLASDIARWSPLVETLGNIKEVTTNPAPESSAAFVFEGTEYRLSDLTDAVDASVEKERLTKELADLQKSIQGLKGRLSNPGYTDKAPEHLVNQTRAELEQKIQDHDSMKASLDKLR